MNRYLLIVFILILSTRVSFAQVGIGTETPHPSTMLDIVGANRGIMIPRVELNSRLDTQTMQGGNVESLLVFNTATTADLQPGYHYWYDGAWRRMVHSDEIEDLETLTTLEALPEGVFVYTSEDGTQTTIDIPAEVLEDLINNGVIYQEILNIIDAQEKITILEDHGDGSYTYYNEQDIDAAGLIIGPGVTINVITDVHNNLLNEGILYDYFVDFVEEHETLTSLVDNADGTFTYTDENGDATTFNANTTTAVEQNGVFNFYDATNTLIISIDTNASALPFDNTGTGLTAVNVQDALEEILNELRAGAGLDLIDNLDGTFSLLADNTTLLGTVAKAKLTDHNSGLYTFSNNNGTDISFDVLSVDLNFDANTNTYTFLDSQGNSIGEIVVPKIQMQDGLNTTVSQTTDITTNTTTFKVDVATADGANLGVVKEADDNPSVLINQDGELSVNLEMLNAVKHIVADYTLELNDQTILANASTGDINIILPNPSLMKGKKFTIKKFDTNQNFYINVTGDIDQIGTETTIYTGVPYTGWDLISDGNKWQIINRL